LVVELDNVLIQTYRHVVELRRLKRKAKDVVNNQLKWFNGTMPPVHVQEQQPPLRALLEKLAAYRPNTLL